jgi:hypothetical protein
MVQIRYLAALLLAAMATLSCRCSISFSNSQRTCRKHLQEFIDFAAGASREPIGFYQAYPGLTVQDIHALIADSKSQLAST